MSVWTDLHKRSIGLTERKEDIVLKKEEREKSHRVINTTNNSEYIWATYNSSSYDSSLLSNWKVE